MFHGIKTRCTKQQNNYLCLFAGVCNFNGKHGCLKCTTVGEYSHQSHTVTFPRTDCPRRNNEEFRLKKYGAHHKYDSPLLQLSIDMIQTFPVCDSLHLIDLGIMKRLLLGWRDGSFGTYITKWCARDISNVTQFLLSCKMPKEIHRSVRALDVLAYWKASEYRTFLLYLSIIILKHTLCSNAYHHFLTFFCAITICSNEKYFNYLPVGEKLLNYFLEHFRDIYGQQYMTSNVHNLCHIIEEVKHFGALQHFNAYPFENKLQVLKKMVRHGNRPLAQIASRLNERKLIDLDNVCNNSCLKYPFIKKCKNIAKNILCFESFILTNEPQDKWFMTSDNNVVELTSFSISINDNQIYLRGNIMKNLENVFETPVKSSLLNIYKWPILTGIKLIDKVFVVKDVKCKIVAIDYKSEMIFAPLLHTL